jgi:predicted DNA-binding protein
MSIAEKRTNIFFPNLMYRRLKNEASAKNISVAEIIRAAIQKHFDEQDINIKNDSFFKIGGIGKSKEGDLSVKHDDYIYGKE